MNHWVRTILDDAVLMNKSLPDYVIKALSRVVDIVEASDVTQFRTIEFENIAYGLSECMDLRDLSRLLWQAVEAAGYKHFSIFVVSQGAARAFATRMCTSYSDQWIDRYKSRNYRHLDPIVSLTACREGSFLFSEADDSAPMVKAFWDDAENHGVGRNGFCFVKTHHSGARIAITFSTDASVETTMSNFRLNGHDLRAICDIAVECFCLLSSGCPLDENLLSDEELALLHQLATRPNPLGVLGEISWWDENEARQNSICRKLQVGTIFQAIAIASSLRWFDRLPFMPEDVIKPFSNDQNGCAKIFNA